MTRKLKHFVIPCLHFLRLLIGNYHCVVRILPFDLRVVNLEFDSPQIRQVYPLIVLLVGCGQYDLLLGFIDIHDIGLFGVGQVPDSPLKSVHSILPHKDGVGGGGRQQIILWIKSFTIIANFIFPLSLTKVLGSLPLSHE